MKLIFILGIFVSLSGCKEFCDRGNNEQTVHCLKDMPKEDILAIPAVKSYLEHHKVYISYTTSPDRLAESIWMLKALDTTHVEKIFVSLPKLFKNKEPYGEIPADILNFDKVELIARDQEDLGPIMKILPAIEKVRPLDPNAIVISVDDDTGLQNGAIGQLIKYAVLYPDAIVAGAGSYAELFGIKPGEWPSDPMTTKKPYCGSGGFSYCNIVEGYRGVAYKPRLFNSAKMIEMTKASKSCRTSDDVVLSYVLALDNIPRIRIANNYMFDVHRFAANEDGSALHKAPKNPDGSFEPHWSWESFIAGGTHSDRYQRCVHEYKLKFPQHAQTTVNPKS